MFSFFKKLVLVFLTLLLAFCVFIYWASSPKLNAEKYVQKIHFGEFLKTDADSVFTLITYNIGYLSGMTNNLDSTRNKKMFDGNLKIVEQAFEQHNPDFLALQEVDFGGSRAYEVNQFESLGNYLGFHEGGMAVNWDKNYVPFPYSISTKNHFGNVFSGQGILSKYPISNHDASVLERPDNPFWYDLFYIDRLAQVAEVKVGSQKIYIINVHLEAYKEEARRKQTEVVLKMYQDLSEKQITFLVGDFNSEPSKEAKSNPTIDILLKETGLISTCPTEFFNTENALTFPADFPNKQIDYIFYDSTKVERLAWQVLKTTGTASDHLPLMFKFSFKN
ncbi:MAG: endonuclease/exonuclease/phosphatase family metal-dependent hydrolase [Flammeovirgaceae bacterium]|jgi:endonuclease/exonuclease/phosphatase family metal-dependent hydrolase